jgi:hypothetical protein
MQNILSSLVVVVEVNTGQVVEVLVEFEVVLLRLLHKHTLLQ